MRTSEFSKGFFHELCSILSAEISSHFPFSKVHCPPSSLSEPHGDNYCQTLTRPFHTNFSLQTYGQSYASSPCVGPDVGAVLGAIEGTGVGAGEATDRQHRHTPQSVVTVGNERGSACRGRSRAIRLRFAFCVNSQARAKSDHPLQMG